MAFIDKATKAFRLPVETSLQVKLIFGRIESGQSTTHHETKNQKISNLHPQSFKREVKKNFFAISIIGETKKKSDKRKNRRREKRFDLIFINALRLAVCNFNFNIKSIDNYMALSSVSRWCKVTLYWLALNLDFCFSIFFGSLLSWTRRWCIETNERSVGLVNEEKARLKRNQSRAQRKERERKGI